MRFCLSGEKLNVSKEKDYIMYSLLILNFIIPFVMVLLGYLLKKYPVTDRNSGCGYNTPASRSSQEHWDYAQEIAPDIFLGLGIRLGIIIKERTEGGLNKRAYFVPPYSAHFWFFRIEQSRVRYGDSIFHIFICQLAMQSIYWLESLNHS